MQNILKISLSKWAVLLAVILAGPLGYAAYEHQKAWRQKSLVKRLEKLGASVECDQTVAVRSPLMRFLLGDDRHQTIVRAGFSGIGWATDADLVEFSKLRSLKSAYFAGQPYMGEGGFTGAGLVHLEELPLLESLSLHGTRISDTSLEHIGKMDRLRELNLTDTKITDEGAKHLAHLPQLEVLYLNDTLVGDAGMTKIGNLTKLERLCLNSTQIGDEGLAHLDGLTRLKELRVGKTQVTDKGLPHLQKLTKIEILDLNNLNLTDAGLESITALKELKDLRLYRESSTLTGDLNESRITEKCFDTLARLPNLKNVDLIGNNISIRAYDRIKPQFPNCSIWF